MKFLKQVIENDERPLCRSHLHFIYLASGFFWFAGLSAIGWVADYNLWLHFGAYIPQYEINNQYVRIGLEPGLIGSLFSLGGAFIFATEFLKYASTDIVVTSKRLLYKTGFIKVKLDATDLVDVLGIHIDQGWFGQFLGYGKMHIDCRFVEDVYIPYAKNPYGILKTMQKAKGDLGTSHEKTPDDAVPMQSATHQTLIQTQNIYMVDKVPPDDKTPLRQLPKNIGENLLLTFKRKA